MDVNDDETGAHAHASGRPSLAETLEAAGITLAELEARLYDCIFGRADEPPCRRRHPGAGEPPAPAPVRLGRRRGCTFWIRRPTRRTAAGSSWAPARIGCPGG